MLPALADRAGGTAPLRSVPACRYAYRQSARGQHEPKVGHGAHLRQRIAIARPIKFLAAIIKPKCGQLGHLAQLEPQLEGGMVYEGPI